MVGWGTESLGKVRPRTSPFFDHPHPSLSLAQASASRGLAPKVRWCPSPAQGIMGSRSRLPFLP